MKREDKKLHQAVEDAFTMAEGAFNSDGGFQTMVLIDFENNRSLGLPLVNEDLVDARREIILGLGSFAAMAENLGLLGKPLAVRMVSEAWLSTPPQDGSRPATMPSKDPNKREALIAYGSDYRGYQAHRVKEIVRSIKDVDGDMEEVVKLVDFEDIPMPKNPKPGEVGYANILELYWNGYKETIDRIGDVSLGDAEMAEIKKEIGDTEEEQKSAIAVLMGKMVEAALKAHMEMKQNDSNKS